MKYKITFDESARVLVVKTSGAMTGADFIKMAEDLLKHPECASGGNVIFDHSDLDFSGVSVEELEVIRRFHQKNENRIGDGKSAMVVKPGFLQKWHELWGQGQKIKTKNKVTVFENFSNAASWVQTEE
jgi:hypothetical protein